MRAYFTSLILVLLPLQSQGVMTNPLRTDGFGAQFQSVIYAAVYAELTGHQFLYTPFTSMEHNYDNDPEFLAKKEQLINFIGNFEINEDPNHQIEAFYHYYFCESHWDAFAQSSCLQKVKEVFRKNKQRQDYFDPDAFSVAVHIRRPNPHDSRVLGTNTPDSFFLNVLSSFREQYTGKHPTFHIYSQGELAVFEQLFGAEDTVFHINSSIEETFASMVFADVLVIGKTSFSYTAALLSGGTIYYLPFWHPPLPHWRVLTEDGTVL
jgi:hypothetical protein